MERPPRLDPFLQCDQRQSQAFGPLGQCERSAVVAVPDVAAAVAALLFLRRPANVTGLVAAGVVDTIHAVLAGWSRADVFQESGKVRTPRIADKNTAPTVVVVSGVVWVVAPLHHSAPDCVLCATVLAVLCHGLALCAAARNDPAFTQVNAADRGGAAAIATANPILHATPSAVWALGGKPPVPEPRYVD